MGPPSADDPAAAVAAWRGYLAGVSSRAAAAARVHATARALLAGVDADDESATACALDYKAACDAAAAGLVGLEGSAPPSPLITTAAAAERERHTLILRLHSLRAAVADAEAAAAAPAFGCSGGGEGDGMAAAAAATQRAAALDDVTRRINEVSEALSDALTEMGAGVAECEERAGG